jgi:hypothetical protein
LFQIITSADNRQAQSASVFGSDGRRKAAMALDLGALGATRTPQHSDPQLNFEVRIAS